MTLVLQNESYKPPTGYAILADQGFPIPNAAASLYATVEALKTTGWFLKLAQYGVEALQWRGMLDDITADLTPDTIHLMLPRGPGSNPGFMTQWQAFHNYIGGLVFAWLPASTVPYGPAVLTLDQWMIGATHELVEALTDAEPGTGWVNPAARDEIADECEQLPGIGFGQTFVSSYWLNDHNRCFQAGDM